MSLKSLSRRSQDYGVLYVAIDVLHVEAALRWLFQIDQTGFNGSGVTLSPSP